LEDIMNPTENVATHPGETERVQDIDAAHLSDSELDAVAGGVMEWFHAYAVRVAAQKHLDRMLP
jgi:hypothetical protein